MEIGSQSKLFNKEEKKEREKNTMTEEQSKFYLLLNSKILSKKTKTHFFYFVHFFFYVCFYFSKSLCFTRFYIQRVYFLCHRVTLLSPTPSRQKCQKERLLLLWMAGLGSCTKTRQTHPVVDHTLSRNFSERCLSS